MKLWHSYVNELLSFCVWWYEWLLYTLSLVSFELEVNLKWILVKRERERFIIPLDVDNCRACMYFVSAVQERASDPDWYIRIPQCSDYISVTLADTLSLQYIALYEKLLSIAARIEAKIGKAEDNRLYGHFPNAHTFSTLCGSHFWCLQHKQCTTYTTSWANFQCFFLTCYPIFVCNMCALTHH